MNPIDNPTNYNTTNILYPTNPAASTPDEFDWLQFLLDCEFLDSIAPKVAVTTEYNELQAALEVISPFSNSSVDTTEQLLESTPATTTSNSTKKESKKRKREQKKNEFFEQVVSLMTHNIETNPLFSPRKCTKYSPKSTPYDHMKLSFSFQ